MWLLWWGQRSAGPWASAGWQRWWSGCRSTRCGAGRGKEGAGSARQLSASAVVCQPPRHSSPAVLKPLSNACMQMPGCKCLPALKCLHSDAYSHILMPTPTCPLLNARRRRGGGRRRTQIWSWGGWRAPCAPSLPACQTQPCCQSCQSCRWAAGCWLLAAGCWLWLLHALPGGFAQLALCE